MNTIQISKNTFYDWFVQLCYFKDTRLLIDLIKRAFYTIYLKKHKYLFYQVINFFKTIYYFLLAGKSIKGYSLFFKGKLAKQGSVRKNIIFAKRGLTSFTNKGLRVNIRTYQLWTVTGCLGAGINVFYKVYVYTNIFVHN